MILQPTRLENERQAMITMAESYRGDKVIFIADRGYESYNLYEHIRHTGNYFLIRIKDGSSRPFRSLPKRGEYDKEINITFTKSQTNEAKENYNKHLWLAHTQKFDYLSSSKDIYQKSYRVVRIRIDGLKDKYEVLITNLPKDTISTMILKNCTG